MTIQCALIGVQESGKTSLLESIRGESFSSTYIQTAALDIRVVKSDEKHEFRFKDFGGAEKWLEINKANIRANIHFFVIDPYQDLNTQLKYFENYLPVRDPITNQPTHEFISICNIVISKSDLLAKKPENERETFRKAIEEYQNMLVKTYNFNCEIVTTSAKLNTGKDELLKLITKQLGSNISSAQAANTSLASSAAYLGLGASSSANQTSDEAKSSNGNTVPDYDSKFMQGLSSTTTEKKAALQALFERELALAGNNLKAIQALVAAAEPYLNEHKNPRKDKFFGIHNTATWQHCLKLARDQGLASLTAMTYRKSTLIYWEKQTLFSTHRGNSVLVGAFGKTHAQKEIERLIKNRRIS